MNQHTLDRSWRVRPSVSVVVNEGEDGTAAVQFFRCNTRRSTTLRMRADLAALVTSLDGSRALRTAASASASDPEQAQRLVEDLAERCIVESTDTAAWIEASPDRRTLQYVQDWLPESDLRAGWDAIRSTLVAIVGCGGAGSWIARGVAGMGFRRLLLVDPDVVEASNLNRSLYGMPQAGASKAGSLATALRGEFQGVEVAAVRRTIGATGDVEAAWAEAGLDPSAARTVVVNCADQPNVDLTSAWVGRFCMKHRIRHHVAGGYNLHLSLIGLSVVPFESPCVQCVVQALDERSPRVELGVVRLNRPKRKIGSVGTAVALSASLSALEVMKLALHGDRIRPAMLGRRGEMDMITGKIEFRSFERHPRCLWCGPEATPMR